MNSLALGHSVFGPIGRLGPSQPPPHAVRNETTAAGQLNFRFAALAKARIAPISRLICASKAAGVIGIGSKPCRASFSRTPGDVIDYRIAFLTKNQCPPIGLKPHTDILKEFPYQGTPH